MRTDTQHQDYSEIGCFKPHRAASASLALIPTLNQRLERGASRRRANPMGVATYQLHPQLPKEYEGQLPTYEDWQRLINSASE